ncbi:MAG: TetR/AcrR family transcriptional regulator [Actinomycetota bacterium]|nr:TetR/AcrR family transcriptional regulator [Actinomycetota bacterium]
MTQFNADTDSLINLLADDSRQMSKSEKTRLKIMASAAKAFNEKGFSETSIQEIADNAGVAKGTIYYYVEKKEDLVLMLVQFSKARLFSKIEKGIARSATASEKLEAVIRSHLKVIKIVGPIMPFFVLNIVKENSRLKKLIGELREEYLNILVSIIDEGVASGEFKQVDSKKIAVAILGLIIGQLFQYRIFTGKFNTKAIAETTTSLMLHGLRRGDEG